MRSVSHLSFFVEAVVHLTCTLIIVLNPVVLLHLYLTKAQCSCSYALKMWALRNRLAVTDSRMDACMSLPLLQLALLF